MYAKLWLATNSDDARRTGIPVVVAAFLMLVSSAALRADAVDSVPEEIQVFARHLEQIARDGVQVDIATEIDYGFGEGVVVTFPKNKNPPAVAVPGSERVKRTVTLRDYAALVETKSRDVVWAQSPPGEAEKGRSEQFVHSLSDGRAEQMRVLDPKRSPSGLILAPESLDHMDWSLDLALGVRPWGWHRYLRPEDLQDAQVVRHDDPNHFVIELRDERGRRHLWTLDGGREGTVVRYVVEVGKEGGQELVVEASELKKINGRWLPMRIVRTMPAPKGGQGVTHTISVEKWKSLTDEKQSHPMLISWPAGSRIWEQRVDRRIIAPQDGPIEDEKLVELLRAVEGENLKEQSSVQQQ